MITSTSASSIQVIINNNNHVDGYLPSEKWKKVTLPEKQEHKLMKILLTSPKPLEWRDRVNLAIAPFLKSASLYMASWKPSDKEGLIMSSKSGKVLERFGNAVFIEKVPLVILNKIVSKITSKITNWISTAAK